MYLQHEVYKKCHLIVQEHADISIERRTPTSSKKAGGVLRNSDTSGTARICPSNAQAVPNSAQQTHFRKASTLLSQSNLCKLW